MIAGRVIPLFVYLTLVFAMAACSRSQKVPSGILSPEEMGRIMYDIGLAEGAVETEYYRDSARNKDSLLRAQLDKVMRIHATDRRSFQHSYAFYKKHPQIMKRVVDSLQARSLRNQQKMFQGVRKRERSDVRLELPSP